MCLTEGASPCSVFLRLASCSLAPCSSAGPVLAEQRLPTIAPEQYTADQKASNSALATSSVATWFEVRISPGLLGACSAQNQRRDSGPVRV